MPGLAGQPQLTRGQEEGNGVDPSLAFADAGVLKNPKIEVTPILFL